MTHILRGNGLLATAIEAVRRMQVELVDELHEMGPADVALGFQRTTIEDLQEVDTLLNKLYCHQLLWNEDRLLLRECVLARWDALNMDGATAPEQRVMGECDKILELTK